MHRPRGTSTRALTESRPPVANTCRKAGRRGGAARDRRAIHRFLRGEVEPGRATFRERVVLHAGKEPDRAVGRQSGESRLPQERRQRELNFGRPEQHRRLAADQLGHPQRGVALILQFECVPVLLAADAELARLRRPHGRVFGVTWSIGSRVLGSLCARSRAF